MRKAIDLLVILDSRILLARKGDVWILPGGKPEAGESDLECLYREGREELGTGVFAENFYKSFKGRAPHKKDILQADVYFCSLMNYENLFPRKGDSIKEIKFVSNPFDYNLSEITRGVVDSLVQDGYLK